MNPILALSACALTLCPPQTGSGPCDCPEMTSGWVLFDDSSRRVPDFWRRDSLEVQQIILCRHGLTFVFLARDAGSLYLASLMMVDPTAAAPRLAQKLSEWRDDPGTRGEKYTRIVQAVRELSSDLLAPGRAVDLRLAPADQKAWIFRPSSRLALRWHNREVILRGYLDVYLRAIV
jgi:hypothetical protein